MMNPNRWFIKKKKDAHNSSQRPRKYINQLGGKIEQFCIKLPFRIVNIHINHSSSVNHCEFPYTSAKRLDIICKISKEKGTTMVQILRGGKGKKRSSEKILLKLLFCHADQWGKKQ